MTLSLHDPGTGLGWPRSNPTAPALGWPVDYHVSRETSVPRPADDVPRETDIPAAPAVDVPRETERPRRELTSDAEAAPATGRTAPPDLPRLPPGPRRARFDQDELAPTSAPEPRDPVGSQAARPSFPLPISPRIMVVANQKGGVGKTTTAVNVATALALGGLRVLVMDLDPQGNASTALGVDHPPGTLGTYEALLAGEPLSRVAVASPEAPNLMVVPATIDLAGAEIELVSTVARENRLLKALTSYLAEHPTDYVFLDCPPSLGLLTLNALVAATELLIPIQCEYYALEGVSQLMRTINLVKGELNDALHVSTVLLTMYDGRTKLAAQVADEVRAHFAAETLPVVIPRSVRISEAPSFGQSVLTYHPGSVGAKAYLEAAAEIARRGAEAPDDELKESA